MGSNVKTVAVLLSALAVSACAGASGRANSYNAELDQLQADCRARDGILVATGAQTGQPARDNVCRITGGASRLR